MRKASIILGFAFMMLMTSSCGTIYRKIKYSSKDIQISNPCAVETGLDFKIVSLIGDKDEQTLTFTGKFINHDVNKNVSVGGNFVSYDMDGNGHNALRDVKAYKALTDTWVKFSFRVPGKLVPKRNKQMAVIAFDIDDCRIELRNVPIIWKKIEKEEK